MSIRAARPEDALQVARVHVRAWQVGYAHLLPKTYLEGLREEERAQRYDFANTDSQKPKTFVAVAQSVITGFATIAPAKDSKARYLGEVCALHVDPDHWGEGTGGALLSYAQLALHNMGCREALLWVLMGNARADRFYRRHGWLEQQERRSEIVWGISVEEVRYQRTLP